MLDLAAIAQSSPGSIAVNVSILVGYRVAGVPGALLTTLGSALLKQKRVLPLAVFAGAFAATRYLKVNTLLIILLCGLLGAGDTWLRGRREGTA